MPRCSTICLGLLQRTVFGLDDEGLRREKAGNIRLFEARPTIGSRMVSRSDDEPLVLRAGESSVRCG
jgi:hypothetical protein